MFSGITSGLFAVTRVNKEIGLISYSVKLNDLMLKDLKIGASVAIDGVCQTVIKIDKLEVSFQCINETLNCTTLNDLYVGRKVSVELSLGYGDSIGGHEMTGHVIGTATIIKIASLENNLSLVLSCSKTWLKYILTKGFIGVDGSSLTINKVDEQKGNFSINLIPETLRLTNFGNKKIGARVNIELDFKTQAIVHTVERILTERVRYPLC